MYRTMHLYESHNPHSTRLNVRRSNRGQYNDHESSSSKYWLERKFGSEVGEFDEVNEKLKVEDLSAGFGKKRVLEDVTISFKENAVTAIIGPSGCGKSTLIRCLNRMHEVTPGAWVSGKVYLDQENVLSDDIDPVLVRRKIGMVFQKPNPFPTMSVFDNVASGLRLNGT